MRESRRTKQRWTLMSGMRIGLGRQSWRALSFIVVLPPGKYSLTKACFPHFLACRRKYLRWWHHTVTLRRCQRAKRLRSLARGWQQWKEASRVVMLAQVLVSGTATWVSMMGVSG